MDERRAQYLVALVMLMDGIRNAQAALDSSKEIQLHSYYRQRIADGLAAYQRVMDALNVPKELGAWSDVSTLDIGIRLVRLLEQGDP